MVYADSLNPVAAPGYRFSGGPHSPGTADLFRQSIAKVAALPCDLVIAVHPGFTDVERKLKERTGNPGGPDPFIDARGCRRYAEDAAHGLAARLAEERAAP